jgi:phospholipid/cholesterol/gamma-HCH transport system ATP-binding protein
MGSTDWSVEFCDVHKSFGQSKVLAGVSVAFPPGRISVVLGPSGTGKSVLLKHLIGLLHPDRGDVLVRGESVPGMRTSQLLKMRERFGILFQDGALFGSMDVYDNVAFALRQHTDLTEDEVREIVALRLSQVGLTSVARRLPGELSGGMRKRAGFARALAMEPEVVLFDEPDSGLDPVRTALLSDLIREVHAVNGGTYIVVTHNIGVAKLLADFIAVLWKGRVVEAAAAGEVFASDDHFVRQFLSAETLGPLGMD